MKPLIERLGHCYVANLKKSKMAASKKNYDKITMSILKIKLSLLTFYKKINGIVIRTGVVIKDLCFVSLSFY